jgi:hypothetical protein
MVERFGSLVLALIFLLHGIFAGFLDCELSKANGGSELFYGANFFQAPEASCSYQWLAYPDDSFHNNVLLPAPGSRLYTRFPSDVLTGTREWKSYSLCLLMWNDPNHMS